ncbi:MAG: terminase family protein [Gemmatimonadota bacterium]|nr:MAG: terminase family protein [Gemmatimonadota bacterium]
MPFNRLALYRPYPKQAEFHALGATKRERALLAANQSGKTLAAACEVAMHLTGRYPDWWKGRRFAAPTKGWASNTNNETTRDNPQRLLLGQNEQWGTGTIPSECVEKVTMSRGIANAVDTVSVRHVSGGFSRLQFKAYEQERQKWQGESLDFVWFDEEPPYDVYTEGLTRTNATGGVTLLTATPLLGMTQVVTFFYPHPSTTDRALVQMDITDAEHYSDEEIRRIIDSYPEYEREARVKGRPMLGSGRVFPISDSQIQCEPFEIPGHWPQLGAIDFGWDHPTAAVRLAWDRDRDCLYVVQTYKQAEATPAHHAMTLRRWGLWLPWSWPHDGYIHDRSSGKTTADLYRAEGLRMLREHATFPDGGIGTEAGLMEMLDRMKTGRWKVFSVCEDWFAEFHVYHRKEGKVVKENDDLISASRIGLMARRFARTEESRAGAFPATVGLDYNPLGATAPR